MSNNAQLVLSPHVTFHEQHGAFYVYHNLFGYLLKMSHDVAALLATFRSPMTGDFAVERFGAAFGGGAQVEQFLQVFRGHSCIVEPGQDETKDIWAMFPVINRWTVFHAPKDGPLVFHVVDRNRKVQRVELEPWQRVLWQACTGNATLSAILPALRRDPLTGERIDVSPALVADTVRAWVGLDMQVLRLSNEPMDTFRHQPHRVPMYLRSVMPFREIKELPPVPLDEPLEERRFVSPRGYYAGEVATPETQFDLVETTLSHLLRDPTPVLGGQSYAARLADALAKRGCLGPETRSFLEIGGGLGHLAKGLLEAVQQRRPANFGDVRYTILDLSPVLQAAQRQTLGAHAAAVHFQTADAETADLGEAQYDLIVSNEVIGDFTAVRLTRAELGIDPPDAAETPGNPTAELAAAPELDAVRDLVRRLELPLGDAPETFYLNVGAIRLIEKLWRALRPGGAAVLTEYGDEHRYPMLNTLLDHPEFSIHFGLLRHVAQRLGFRASFEFVIDFLEFQRDEMTLGATRSSFVGLQQLFAEHGLALDKRAYTPATLKALVGDRLRLDEVFPLPFEPVENRCMGLVPFQFKVLVLQKP